MIKFLIGLGITIIYSFFIYATDKQNTGFSKLIGMITIGVCSYYLGDLVLYKYTGSLT